MVKTKRVEGKKRPRQWRLGMILCFVLTLVIVMLTIIVLRKPRNVTWSDVDYSLSLQTVASNGAFAEEGLWFHTVWDGPTGEFSSGQIYGIKLGSKILRFDIIDDPIAAIEKRLPNTVPGLLELFASQNHLEKRCAGEALIKLGPRAHTALPVLLERFGAGDEQSDPVILELAKAAGASAVSPLMKALKEANPKIRQKAAEALGEIGTDAEDSVASLTETLHDSDSAVIVTSALALRKIDEQNHGEVQAITELLTNKNSQVCAAAIFALGEFGESAESSVPALLKLLETGQTEHNGFLARTLGLIGPTARPAIPHIIKLLESNDRQILMFSMEALGRFGEHAKESIPRLLALANEPEQMWGAITALSFMGTDAVPVLIDLYGNGNNKQSSTVARAFMKQGSGAATAVPYLITGLQSESAGRTALAALTLGYIGDRAKPAIPHLLKLIDDENPEVRIRAAEALWKIDRQTNAVLPVMIDELKEWSKDPNALSSLRSDASDQSRQQVAANVLGEVGSDAREAIPLLQMMLRSSYDSQREAAEKALEQVTKTAH